jgi:DNA-binding SARP family transcriptional activator
MAALRLTLLGGVEARLASGPTVSFPRKKSEALLAYLALHAGQMQARDKLALERAAGLYRGDLLEGLAIAEPPFEEWLTAERERLLEMGLEALVRLLAHQIRIAVNDEAVQTAIRVLGLDPTQESVHRSLMRLYARQGRRGAAPRQYQICIATLERELGVEPEPETKQLYRELLQAPEAAAACRHPLCRSPPPSTSPRRNTGSETTPRAPSYFAEVSRRSRASWCATVCPPGSS